MKKLTIALFAMLSMAFTVKAQQYVSTEPANRNVVLEEFTGRTCTWCPSGHVIANNIASSHPDRFWSVNIHSDGYFSATSYPNLNTTKGNSIRAAFNASSFPSGVVNRTTAAAVGRGEWTGQANTQFNQTAECNLGGIAQINPDTRVANIIVEVYYTGNSSADENYLTIMMLQDSIWGSQTGGSDNPAQWVNGQYCHMHIFRDIITANMGDAISPTTQGTLITKTYEYQIPESIGSPNGVEVDLDNIHFVAFVSERYQGTPTRPILNACELVCTTMTNDPIHPFVRNMAQLVNASCSHTKTFKFDLFNGGLDAFNTVKYTVTVGDAVADYEWNGNLTSGNVVNVEFDMDIPLGTYEGNLNITEVNGVTYEYSTKFGAKCDEWVEYEVEGDVVTLKLFVIQDQMGQETTWDIINSAGEVVAEGGPYNNLAGSGTLPNVTTLSDLPTDECYLFRIYDSAGNGICCNYGNGHYYIKHGTAFLIDAEGNFGEEASHLISLKKKDDGVIDNTAASFKVYPNPANSKIYVEGAGISTVEVYNSVGQMVTSVEGSANTAIDATSFENGIYVVRLLTSEGAVSTQKVSIVH